MARNSAPSGGPRPAGGHLDGREGGAEAHSRPGDPPGPARDWYARKQVRPRLVTKAPRIGRHLESASRPFVSRDLECGPAGVLGCWRDCMPYVNSKYCTCGHKVCGGLGTVASGFEGDFSAVATINRSPTWPRSLDDTRFDFARHVFRNPRLVGDRRGSWDGPGGGSWSMMTRCVCRGLEIGSPRGGGGVFFDRGNWDQTVCPTVGSSCFTRPSPREARGRSCPPDPRERDSSREQAAISSGKLCRSPATIEPRARSLGHSVCKNGLFPKVPPSEARGALNTLRRTTVDSMREGESRTP